MSTKPIADAMQETIDFCARALTRIERAEGADTELHNIRAYILNTLEMIETDPDIQAASDAFYGAATEYVTELDRELIVSLDGEPRVSAARREAVEAALARFAESLLGARPNERGRGMGLT